jgi:hypothetical protein
MIPTHCYQSGLFLPCIKFVLCDLVAWNVGLSLSQHNPQPVGKGARPRASYHPDVRSHRRHEVSFSGIPAPEIRSIIAIGSGKSDQAFVHRSSVKQENGGLAPQ